MMAVYPCMPVSSSPPPRMSARAPTHSLLMGGSFTLVTSLAVFPSGLPCPSCPLRPFFRPPQRLMVPVPRSHSRHPLPCSDAIIFALGTCNLYNWASSNTYRGYHGFYSQEIYHSYFFRP